MSDHWKDICVNAASYEEFLRISGMPHTWFWSNYFRSCNLIYLSSNKE